MIAATSTIWAQAGPIAATVALGMAAIGILLPKPRRGPVLLGLLLGALALAAMGVLLLGVAQVTVESLLFYAFSALALISGTVMITQANPARAALAFAVVVLSTCGLFLLNAAPFLMAGTVIIYAGAIVVTFLFVLMLAQPDAQSDADRRSREPVLAVIAGFFLLSTLLLVLRQSFGLHDYNDWLARIEAARAQPVEQIWQILGNDEQFRQDSGDVLNRTLGREAAAPILALVLQKDDIRNAATPGSENRDALRAWLDRLAQAAEQNRAVAARHVGRLSPPPRDTMSPFAGSPPNQQPQALSADNVAGLGRTLFSDYLLAVEIGGTLLLIATIGAIAIAQRPPARRSS